MQALYAMVFTRTSGLNGESRRLQTTVARRTHGQGFEPAPRFFLHHVRDLSIPSRPRPGDGRFCARFPSRVNC